MSSCAGYDALELASTVLGPISNSCSKHMCGAALEGVKVQEVCACLAPCALCVLPSIICRNVWHSLDFYLQNKTLTNTPDSPMLHSPTSHSEHSKYWAAAAAAQNWRLVHQPHHHFAQHLKRLCLAEHAHAMAGSKPNQSHITAHTPASTCGTPDNTNLAPCSSFNCHSAMGPGLGPTPVVPSCTLALPTDNCRRCSCCKAHQAAAA